MNKKVAKLLRHHAILLRQSGERNRFRLAAYYKAANKIEQLQEDIATIDPTSIEGIGSKIAAKIAEIVATGDFSQRKQLATEHDDISDLIRVPGVGPVTAEKFASILKQHGKDLSVSALKALVADGIIEVNNTVRTGLSIVDQISEERLSYDTAMALAQAITGGLEPFAVHDGQRPLLAIVGSLRRKSPTIGDIDILICTDQSHAASEAFCASGTVLVRGDKKISKVIGGCRCDLRFAKRDEWGAMLLYFTGSKAFNQFQRAKAKSRGWTLNEYGLYDENRCKIAGATEESIFEALNMDFVEPEERSWSSNGK